MQTARHGCVRPAAPHQNASDAPSVGIYNCGCVAPQGERFGTCCPFRQQTGLRAEISWVVAQKPQPATFLNLNIKTQKNACARLECAQFTEDALQLAEPGGARIDSPLDARGRGEAARMPPRTPELRACPRRGRVHQRLAW